MKIHGIEKVSKMLAEFDFGDVEWRIEIEVSFSPLFVWSDIDPFSFEIKSNDKNLNPKIWNRKSWTKWIKSQAKSIGEHFCDGGKRFSIDELYIEHKMKDEIIRCLLFWSVDENCFTSIRVFDDDGISQGFTYITLYDVDVKSSDDVIKIVCACTEFSEDDFVRVE